MKFPLLPVLVACTITAQTCPARAESLLRPGDVVALVGGEEMVSAAEAGEMEFALITAAPELHLTVRSLAWEGDTVYEQHRDLNYPKLEEQLAKIGATVVLAQFGQIECLGGPAKLTGFVAAYERLLTRLGGENARRLVLFPPHHFSASGNGSAPDLTIHNDDADAYAAAIRTLAQKRGAAVAEWTFSSASAVTDLTRDGIHLNHWGEVLRAQGLAGRLLPEAAGSLAPARKSAAAEALLRLIIEKDRLWFNYYRPQNWAFLAGDRTSQPSSRDYLDQTKRWFPEEMEQYLPLIENQEREIWKRAEKLRAARIEP